MPHSIWSPCLQTGRLESPKVILRAVSQSAFGSTPFTGNSLFSLACSTGSVIFLCVHTSSQIRCLYFPVVLMPCHDMEVFFFTQMNIIHRQLLLPSPYINTQLLLVDWEFQVEKSEAINIWMTKLNISANPRRKCERLKSDMCFMSQIIHAFTFYFFWGDTLPIVCVVLEMAVDILCSCEGDLSLEGQRETSQQMASLEHIASPLSTCPNKRSKWWKFAFPSLKKKKKF